MPASAVDAGAGQEAGAQTVAVPQDGTDATVTNYVDTREIYFIPIVNPDGLAYVQASDEHGFIEAAPGASAPALGEKLLLVPGHCDPTINLHDWYVGVRRGVVESLWAITARGALT